MSDGATESWFDQNPGGVRETIIGGSDGGVGPTSVYNTWNDYDAGRSSGSYSNESPSFVNQFGGFAGNVGKSFLKNYMNNKSSGGAAGEKPAFAIGGAPSGFSMSAMPGTTKHKMYQYRHPTPTIIGGTPGTPGKSFLDYAIPVAGLGLQAAALCDERVKVDMAPLESSDINDDLAEIAFFVKGLRECV